MENVSSKALTRYFLTSLIVGLLAFFSAFFSGICFVSSAFIGVIFLSFMLGVISPALSFMNIFGFFSQDSPKIENDSVEKDPESPNS